jgi:hypothetical protein
MERNTAPHSTAPTPVIDCGSVEIFTAEAEAAISALYQTVRESYGDSAAKSAAQRWLDAFESRLDAVEMGPCFLRNVTRAAIRLFLASHDPDYCDRNGSLRAAMKRA